MKQFILAGTLFTVVIYGIPGAWALYECLFDEQNNKDGICWIIAAWGLGLTSLVVYFGKKSWSKQ